VSGAGDSFSPDVGQTISPDGTPSYNFQGHVMAQGLDLPATVDGARPNDNKIRWLKQADGSLVATLSAYDNGTTSFTGVESEHGPTAYAGLAMNSGGGPSQAYAYAQSDAGNYNSALLIDDAARSSFLQLRTTAKRTVTFGRSSFAGTGSTNVGTLSVPHGLGAAPILALAIPASFGGATWIGYVSETAQPDGTYLYLFPNSGGFNFGAGTTYYFYWLAIS
jgi:hypothetical protein